MSPTRALTELRKGDVVSPKGGGWYVVLGISTRDAYTLNVRVVPVWSKNPKDQFGQTLRLKVWKHQEINLVRDDKAIRRAKALVGKDYGKPIGVPGTTGSPRGRYIGQLGRPRRPMRLHGREVPPVEATPGG